ncbi:MAG TPA: hypothetical protein VNZ94_01090 [Xanthobacteraceae bacterium]|nr:hypothetical protein [Xanthobacteraceae bacterium]
MTEFFNSVDLSRNQSLSADGASNSPLIEYALAGLDRCWLPDHGRWSHIYHLDGRSAPNESIPQSDVFYSLNVLLGLSRVPVKPQGLDLAATYFSNAHALSVLPVRIYAWGMALWAAAELGLELPEDVLRRTRRLLADEDGWLEFRAQDLGMLLIGVVAQARTGRPAWAQDANALFQLLAKRFHAESGLFYDAAGGLRRRFSSFATQTYLAMACYHHGALSGNASAIAMANQCVARLIDLQGPSGEWPWFFDSVHGRVVDFYEVYSVHQYGMAPALLECAEQFEVPRARAALVKGFHWVLGRNQLNRSMLVPELSLSIRSQIRKGELLSSKPRAMRAVTNAMLRRSGGLIEPDNIDLRLECRSYELGWILWSFGRRTDLTDLTHNEAFVRKSVP